MKKYVILLTACINPNGMLYTKLLDSNIRRNQYINAINYYLKYTALPIVFTENSNTDISSLFEKQIMNGRLEILCFNGNEDKGRGKGYGEAEIIDYAVRYSKTIDKNCYLIKITGILIVENLNRLVFLRRFFGINASVQFVANSEFNFSDTRIFISPVAFVIFFLEMKSQIDDSKNIYFEHVFFNTISKNDCKYFYLPFVEEPQIIGCSGTDGKEYRVENYSFYANVSYLDYQLWLILHYKKYSINRMSPIKATVICILCFFVRSYCKFYKYFMKVCRYLA